MEKADIKKKLYFFLRHYGSLQNSSSSQPLVKSYFSLITNCLAHIKEEKDLMKEFAKARTDFERVCCILEHLQKTPKRNACYRDLFRSFFLKKYKFLQLTLDVAENWIEPSRVLSVKEELKRNNGKSDVISTFYRLQSKSLWKNSQKKPALLGRALANSTLAVFYAESAEKASLALANRSIMLYGVGLIDEAICDAKEAVKTPLPQSESTKIYICLGQCYRHKGSLLMAKYYFKKALKSLEKSYPIKSKIYIQRAQRRFDEYFEVNSDFTETITESEWKSSLPKCLKSKMTLARSDNLSSSATKCGAATKISSSKEPHVLVKANGYLLLKNTGRKSGWGLEVARDTKAGEFLASEKCYAVSLTRMRTKFCYSCLKRCYNLIPCKGCPQVGFCSSRCAEVAFKPNCSKRTKLNGHSYDCQGLLPCLRLKSFFTGLDIIDVIDNPEISQLAYACIANTDSQRLLDYVCSVGDYKGGRGHQAFLGSKHVRAVAPPAFDPSDYASIAWLAACSDKHTYKKLFQYTITAVFLTYCFFIGGYPMDWCGNALDNFPSPMNRPKCIPASWVAACLLYHLQAAEINSFSMYETIAQNASFSCTKREAYGKALYPTLSLINHSCNPSALVIMSGRGVSGLITLRPLTRGSEISISYHSDYFNTTSSQRRYFLQSHYLFDCRCEACKNNWSYREKEVEKLICPNCKHMFIATNSTCLECSSTCGPECYRRLLQVYLPKMKACLDNGNVGSEVLKTGAEALNLVQSLLLPPANTLRQVVNSYRLLWVFKYGLWTMEPWLSR